MFKLTQLVTTALLGISLVSLSVHADDATTETTPNKTVAQPTEAKADEHTELKDAVGKYMSLWSKRDLKAMYELENWQGGDKLGEIDYVQAFNKDFSIYEWKITKVELEDDGSYKVLVWLTHNPPKHVLTYVKPDVKLRSTFVQWWKQEEGKYVHLFNIERDRLSKMVPKMDSMPKPKMSTPEEIEELHKH